MVLCWVEIVGNLFIISLDLGESVQDSEAIDTAVSIAFWARYYVLVIAQLAPVKSVPD